MDRMEINPGSGGPFLSVYVCNEDASSQAHMTVHVTPAQLRKLADDLEAELVKKAEAA